jgi:ribosome recycling factor
VFERMEKTIDAVREKFNTVRTGRASPKILDRINVEYYGTLTPLNTIANASTPDSQTIVIQPFDKTCINDIERAIMLSDLGLNPSNDGTCIRLSIPPLTAERRKELAKLVSKLGEDGKVALRNVRRDAIKSMGKIEGVSQDNVKSIEVAIDALTSDFVKKVDELVRQKEVDISKV